MMTPSPWRLLADGSAGVILTVAFEARRGDPGFAELAPHLTGYRVLEAVPPATTVTEVTEPGAYIEPWLAGALADGPPVVGVLGHCAAAPLAAQLAAAIRGSGAADPSLVTVDPVLVDSRIAHGEYRQAVDSLAAHLEPEELATALAPVTARDTEPATTGHALLPVLTGLEDAYRTTLAAACRTMPVPAAMQRQLADRFAAYLAFLAASSLSAAQPPAAAPLGSVVLSGTQDAEYPAHLLVGATTFPVDRSRLLADADVAAFVLKVLGR
ncbi:hypothetical protein ACFHW0_25115 [Micromonospora sp. LOL_025]|uniref:hypothetical protein n=1 Tax=Micromonospora sp. LOL_025 TaxID=3345413 RepID=UPI003A83D02B